MIEYKIGEQKDILIEYKDTQKVNDAEENDENLQNCEVIVTRWPVERVQPGDTWGGRMTLSSKK